MKLSIYPLFLLLFLGFACDLEEEDPDPIIISKDQLLIREVSRNAVIVEEFHYDDEDRMIQEIKNTDSGELQFTITYEYLENKTVYKRVTESTGAILHYEYYAVDELTTRRDRFNEDGTLSYYHIYEYDNADACRYNKRTRFTTDDVFDGEVTYAYSDNNCSYLSTSVDKDEVILSRTTITMDGMNRYNNALKIPSLPLSHGNISAFDFESVNINAEALTYTSTFRYNASDYPVQQTIFYTSGEIEERLFIYQ